MLDSLFEIESVEVVHRRAPHPRMPVRTLKPTTFDTLSISITPEMFRD